MGGGDTVCRLYGTPVSCGRTKGEDESPPESRRTNGDIKSLLRPGTRATGVLCSLSSSSSPSPSTCPRSLDTFCTPARVNRDRGTRFLRRLRPLDPHGNIHACSRHGFTNTNAARTTTSHSRIFRCVIAPRSVLR